MERIWLYINFFLVASAMSYVAEVMKMSRGDHVELLETSNRFEIRV